MLQRIFVGLSLIVVAACLGCSSKSELVKAKAELAKAQAELKAAREELQTLKSHSSPKSAQSAGYLDEFGAARSAPRQARAHGRGV